MPLSRPDRSDSKDMTIVKGGDWKRLLEQLLAETDKAKLKQTSEDLEQAIFTRAMELETGPEGDVERAAMKDAAIDLLHVKVEKLGYPLNPKILGNARRT